jgi:release factor glutamine methyltransferase
VVIGEIVRAGSQILKNAGIQSSLLDTQLLLARFLGKSKLFVLTHSDVDVADCDGFFALLKRREAGEPTQYILGEAEFMSLAFKVNRHTLIPRPDTETLAEYAIKRIGARPVRFLDVGTGSGCIAVSVAKYCANAEGVAVDVSAYALAVAKENAARHGVDGRLEFLQLDILTEVPEGRFDVILSNPPYIETDAIAGLERNVRDFEPYTALWGGADGLRFYRRISELAKTLLQPKGVLAFEVGHTQRAAVMEILKKDGYRERTALEDLSGISRVVVGECRSFC